jgi:signal transduction histidine kinase
MNDAMDQKTGAGSVEVEIAARAETASLAQLREAFQAFTEASTRFEEHYARLERRIAELNLELEGANAKLRSNLAEKQRMQEYLSTLLESLPMGVVGLDCENRIRSRNAAAAVILGVDRESLTGRPVLEVLRWDGQSILEPAGDTGNLVETQRPLGRLLQAGESVEISYQEAGASQRRILRLRMAVTSNRNPEGEERREEAVRVLLIEDVTQMRRLEQQANRKGRLAAMGEIAMNVAHEIRNPLGSIELFASMLHRDLAHDEKNATLAGHICTGVRCVDHIVSNILQFARPQRLICSSFDLNALVEETLIYAEHALRQKGIQTVRRFATAECLICADAELLKQMFLNLFLNAIQATPKDGQVGVEITDQGEYAEMRVWDTGRGLPPDIIGRIFDPFFTTRRKGTGLGLTIVHNIVSVHQGGIDADNRPGGGALFTITLPKNAVKPINTTDFDLLLEEKEADNVGTHIGG